MTGNFDIEAYYNDTTGNLIRLSLMENKKEIAFLFFNDGEWQASNYFYSKFYGTVNRGRSRKVELLFKRLDEIQTIKEVNSNDEF
ncbi:MAG: hypothetical protein QM504_01650 [Pseudomonadota bacterium]